mmetsp:Transcript_1133/g.7361  ORF Transcript_1133/g.7361 Transcript_1133/m.7361 type:complete len:223 (+) Transcript_1133:8838-9506(+)
MGQDCGLGFVCHNLPLLDIKHEGLGRQSLFLTIPGIILLILPLISFPRIDVAKLGQCINWRDKFMQLVFSAKNMQGKSFEGSFLAQPPRHVQLHVKISFQAEVSHYHTGGFSLPRINIHELEVIHQHVQVGHQCMGHSLHPSSSLLCIVVFLRAILTLLFFLLSLPILVLVSSGGFFQCFLLVPGYFPLLQPFLQQYVFDFGAGFIVPICFAGPGPHADHHI